MSRGITIDQIKKILVFLNSKGDYYFYTVPELTGFWFSPSEIKNFSKLAQTRIIIKRLIEANLLTEINLEKLNKSSSQIKRKVYSVSLAGDLILRYTFPHQVKGLIIVTSYKKAFNEIKTFFGKKVVKKFVKKHFYNLNWRRKRLVIKAERKDLIYEKFPNYPFFTKEELYELLAIKISLRMEAEINKLFAGKKTISITDFLLFLKERNPNISIPGIFDTSVEKLLNSLLKKNKILEGLEGKDETKSECDNSALSRISTKSCQLSASSCGNIS